LDQVNGRGPTGKVLNPGTPIIKIFIQPQTVSDPSNPGLAITAGPQTGIHLRDLPDTDTQLTPYLTSTKISPALLDLYDLPLVRVALHPRHVGAQTTSFRTPPGAASMPRAS
jgi:hypothetical protein